MKTRDGNAVDLTPRVISAFGKENLVAFVSFVSSWCALVSLRVER